MNKQTVRDIDLQGKTVLVRVDFNVPLQEGKIMDDTRIVKTLPTINYLLDNHCKVILLSHLGRPDGNVNDKLRLAPIADHLAKLLKKPVIKLNDCVGEEVETKVRQAKPGEIILLENVRFHSAEEKNDLAFAKELALLGDVYVNDAFGAAHRAHASTEGITKYLPAVAGLLLTKEIETLEKIMTDPERPLVGIIGGAKISTKMGVIAKLLPKVDCLLLGGALANTILKAKGVQVGASLVEDEMLSEASKLPIDKKELEIPVDVVVAKDPQKPEDSQIKATGKIDSDDRILDIGPDTIKLFSDIISKAKMVIWNGPLGMFEIPKFAEGTKEIAKVIGESGVKAIVGGGETVDAIKELGLADKIWHISTGGGAMLEFLEGKELPGIKALKNK